MLRGYTLVVDMDGTIVPSPSGGHYHPIRQTHNNPLVQRLVETGRFKTGCPCAYHCLRDYMSRGCATAVVTTAGRRIWWQVYADLKDLLFVATPLGSGPTLGRLLFFAFTGAALFINKLNFKLCPENEPIDTTCEAARVAMSPASIAYVQGMKEIREYRLCGGAPPKPGVLGQEEMTDPTNFDSEIAIFFSEVAGGILRFFILLAALDDLCARFCDAAKVMNQKGKCNRVVSLTSVVDLPPRPSMGTAPYPGTIMVNLSRKYYSSFLLLFNEIQNDILKQIHEVEHDSMKSKHDSKSVGNVPRIFENNGNINIMEKINIFPLSARHPSGKAAVAEEFMAVLDSYYQEKLEKYITGFAHQYTASLLGNGQNNNNNVIHDTNHCDDVVDVREVSASIKATINKFIEFRFKQEQLELKGRFLNDTGDALLEVTRVAEHGGYDDPVVQLATLGIPMSQFENVFPKEIFGDTIFNHNEAHAKDNENATGATESVKTHLSATLAEPPFNLRIRSQPNSVLFVKKYTDKKLSLSWLVHHSNDYIAHETEFDDYSLSPCVKRERFFSLRRSISIGDGPTTVDKAFSEFPPMPFISVASGREEERMNSLLGNKNNRSFFKSTVKHVGAEELGTGVFLRCLLDYIEGEKTWDFEELFSEHIVEAAVKEARFCLHQVLKNAPH